MDKHIPEKLLDLSRRATNARNMYDALCDEFVIAQTTGKMGPWRDAVIAYTKLISDQEHIEKRKPHDET